MDDDLAPGACREGTKKAAFFFGDARTVDERVVGLFKDQVMRKVFHRHPVPLAFQMSNNPRHQSSKRQQRSVPVEPVFYCPILRKRIRRNCGTRERRDARRIQRECRDRLLNGEYEKSGGAITAADAKVLRPKVAATNSVTNSAKSWQEAVDKYRKKKKARSIVHLVSRLSLAERVFENRRKAMGLQPGITVPECLKDEGIDYLQERLLAGEECRYKSRSPTTVNSIVRNVMTFARYCKRKKWIAQLPEVEREDTDEGDNAMKGRPITTEEFEWMLAAVPKVVGEGPAESWRFTLQVLWESAFRVGDVMDFSWDDPRHI